MEMNNPMNALQIIHDLCIDYDGCRTAESLMRLIDEIKEIATDGLNDSDEWIHLPCSVGDKAFWLQRNRYEGGYRIENTDFVTRAFIADAWLNNIKIYKTYEDAQKALEEYKKNGIFR